jgi:hypothetical protein
MDSKCSGAAGYSTESGRHSGTTLTDAARMWPTLMKSDPERGSGVYMRGNATLTGAARNWPTPRTSDTNGSGEHGDGGPDLRTAVSRWATPTARDWKNEEPDQSQEHAPPLGRQVLRWATPCVSDTMGGHKNRSGSRAGELLLKGQAERWATPRATDGEKGGPNCRGGRGDPILPGQAAQWETPTAQDYGNNQGGGMGRVGPVQHSPRGQATVQAGSGGSEKVVLNPSFVEALMGLPIGWTGYALSGTPSCQHKPNEHL